MADPIQGVTGTDAAGVAPASGATANQGPGGTAAQGVAPPAASDTANVAQVQGLLDMINQVAATIPAVDPQRVAELRQAIADGSYRVDPHSAAKQLADIERYLAGPAGG